MTSNWRLHGIARRDERHTAVPDDAKPPGRRRRNRHKWCKGRPGIAHKPKCQPYHATPTALNKNWRVLICTTCGRKLDVYFDSPFWTRRAKPDWVK